MAKYADIPIESVMVGDTVRLGKGLRPRLVAQIYERPPKVTTLKNSTPGGFVLEFSGGTSVLGYSHEIPRGTIVQRRV